MASPSIRIANQNSGSRPLDPCTRRIVYGALRPIDYRPSLLDRLVSRWSRFN